MPLFEKTKNILSKYMSKNKDKRIFDKCSTIYEDNLKNIIKTINIRYFTIHELRHTFITRCQENNIPLHIIQSWVGHEIGSNVTSKIYTHINNDNAKQYINIINEKNDKN